MVYSETLKLKVLPQGLYDITDRVETAVKKSDIQNGICTVFAVGSTSAILINENNPMLIQDIKNALERIAPEDDLYQHIENAHSHIKSSIIGNSQTIPIKDGELVLGEWQKVMVANFDIEDREREVAIVVMGD
ncbi:MAG: secondary thiamine-phosphate synthase enzyme YjbQ [Candidatus Aenigmatarchaeota archaeon]